MAGTEAKRTACMRAPLLVELFTIETADGPSPPAPSGLILLTSCEDPRDPEAFRLSVIAREDDRTPRAM